MTPSLLRRADDVLDALIVPSFTRLGPAIRRRVFDWQDPELAGRTVAITGPTSGLGKATAQRLARANAHLVLIARNPTKLETLAEELTELGAASTQSILCDLSDLAACREAGDALGALSSLDALVHNGGALHGERQVTGDGIELTFATHVVAPFVLTSGAVPALAKGDDPRIVTVSSGGMYSAGLDLDDLQNERDYQGANAYAKAKRAQLDLTGEWALRLSPMGISVHAMHPGWAATPGVTEALPAFDKFLGPLLRSPDEGADTIVWLCGVPSDRIGTDGFWLDRRRRPEAYRPGTRTSSADVAELWERVQALAAG